MTIPMKEAVKYNILREKAEKYDEVKAELDQFTLDVDKELEKLEAIKNLFLPLPEWVEWEEGPVSIEASKMLKLKVILEAED